MLPELDLLDRIIPIARAAGTIVMEVYATEFKVEGKGDASPVTEADHRAEALVLPALARITPGLQVVSEEAASAGRIPVVAERFWLVDPLDGTREFVNRNGALTVNIALVELDTTLLGLVLRPLSRHAFSGASGASASQTCGIAHPPGTAG